VRKAGVDESEIRRGPDNLIESQNWPLLQAQDARDRDPAYPWTKMAERNLSSGLVVQMDFAGEACSVVGTAMQLRGMKWAGYDVDERAVSVWSACDNGTLPQRVLLSRHPHDDGVLLPYHMFANVVDGNMGPNHLDKIKSMRPRADATRREKEAAYRRQSEYMFKYRRQMFRTDRKSECLRHAGKMCTRDWQDPTEVALHRRPLCWAMDSPMCRPWTNYGNCEGLSSADTESFEVWAHQRAVSNCWIVTTENSDNCPLKVTNEPFMTGEDVANKWTPVPLIVCATATDLILALFHFRSYGGRVRFFHVL